MQNNTYFFNFTPDYYKYFGPDDEEDACIP